MVNNKKPKSEIEKTAEDLVEFAFDREGTKWLLTHLPKEADINRVTVEYELQILRIISVGWSISYYLENSPMKTRLSEIYWKMVNEFSRGISETTELMIGKDIDYFQILKDRLNMYVNALSENAGEADPATVIGPEFARTCGNADDIFTFMTGSKMFISTIARVREYLEAVKLR